MATLIRVLLVASGTLALAELSGVVDEKSEISRHVVEVGLDGKVRVEIRSGLKEGDKVVANRKFARAKTPAVMRRPPSSGL